MKINGHYTQVSDTSHDCHHEDLAVILVGNWQLIMCTGCKKRWERMAKCCALDCDLLVEHGALPFCDEHMKDEQLVRAWTES